MWICALSSGGTCPDILPRSHEFTNQDLQMETVEPDFFQRVFTSHPFCFDVMCKFEKRHEEFVNIFQVFYVHPWPCPPPPPPEPREPYHRRQLGIAFGHSGHKGTAPAPCSAVESVLWATFVSKSALIFCARYSASLEPLSSF